VRSNYSDTHSACKIGARLIEPFYGRSWAPHCYEPSILLNERVRIECWLLRRGQNRLPLMLVAAAAWLLQKWALHSLAWARVPAEKNCCVARARPRETREQGLSELSTRKSFPQPPAKPAPLNNGHSAAAPNSVQHRLVYHLLIPNAHRFAHRTNRQPLQPHHADA